MFYLYKKNKYKFFTPNKYKFPEQISYINTN